MSIPMQALLSSANLEDSHYLPEYYPVLLWVMLIGVSALCIRGSWLMWFRTRQIDVEDTSLSKFPTKIERYLVGFFGVILLGVVWWNAYVYGWFLMEMIPVMTLGVFLVPLGFNFSRRAALLSFLGMVCMAVMYNA